MASTPTWRGVHPQSTCVSAYRPPMVPTLKMASLPTIQHSSYQPVVGSLNISLTVSRDCATDSET